MVMGKYMIQKEFYISIHHSLDCNKHYSPIVHDIMI